MPDEVQRLIGKPAQTHLAERQWTGTRVVQQATDCERNAFCAFDALVDLFATLVVGLAPLQFQVRKNAEQRIVDLVRSAQSELGQRCEFFVLGELRLKLHLLFCQLALFFQSLHQLLLRHVALVLAMVGQFAQAGQFDLRSFHASPEKDCDEDCEDEPQSESAPLPAIIGARSGVGRGAVHAEEGQQPDRDGAAPAKGTKPRDVANAASLGSSASQKF